MINRLKSILFSASPDLRKRLIGIFILLLLFNGGVWLLILLSSQDYPLLLGLSVLAYGLGFRHAVDADHIAAIDNTTRKLVHDGQKPVTV